MLLFLPFSPPQKNSFPVLSLHIQYPGKSGALDFLKVFLSYPILWVAMVLIVQTYSGAKSSVQSVPFLDCCGTGILLAGLSFSSLV